MKKLLACGLILSTLMSFGSVCFAAGYGANIGSAEQVDQFGEHSNRVRDIWGELAALGDRFTAREVDEAATINGIATLLGNMVDEIVAATGESRYFAKALIIDMLARSAGSYQDDGVIFFVAILFEGLS